MNDSGHQRADAHGRGHEDRTARLERQLAAAQQITHVGSWEWEPATNTVTWSDELYRIYGLEPQSCDITFEIFLAKVHPDDRERITGEVQRAMERGGRFAYPERIFRPDGTMRHLQTVGQAHRDASGRIVGLIGTCRDVTDQHERDEAILLYRHIVENVQIGLTVWCVKNPERPGDATLVSANPAARRLVGASLDENTGNTIASVLPRTKDVDLLGMLADVARTSRVHDMPAVRFVDDGRTFSIKAFPLPGHCVGLTFEDGTAEARSQRLKDAEQNILEMIASGSPLTDVLTKLVLLIEEQAPPTIASILLMDETGNRVRTGAAPHLPAEYNQAIDLAPIGPTAGSCGTAAFFKEPVYVVDIDSDRRWHDYRALAQRFGLRACWSTPILATDSRVLGTFALYYREPRAPTDAERSLIARATHLAGIAIHRAQVDDQLRALTARIEAVREDERTSVAREIHDELGQALTALKMDLAWLRRHPDEGPLTEKLDAMVKMSDDLIDAVRRIAASLRPGVLDDLGLVAAIEWQAQEFERRTGTACVVDADIGDLHVERDVGTALFRIFQEALTNVARHADASVVDVRLERSPGYVRLRIKDDGRGILPETLSRPTSLGLLGMAERARRLGGRLDVSGEPERGSIIEVEVPIGQQRSS